MSKRPTKRKPPNESVENTIDSSTSAGKMIAGLADEIDAARTRATKVVLKDGRLSGQVGDLYIYDFALIDELPFQEEANLVISIGKRTGIRGYIHALGKNSISVASEENVGELLDQIQISNSDSASLERLKDILTDLATNPTSLPFSERMASFVIAEQVPVVAALKSIPDNVLKCFQGMNGINTEQERAIRIAMGSEMLLLWGPPGTGKTTTIAPILASLASNGESVLLVSNTNKAVDGALEKVIDNLDKLGLDEVGTCIRIGKGTTEAFKNKYGSRAYLNTVAEDQNRELVAEQAALHERRGPIVRRLEQGSADLNEYKSLDASLADLVKHQQKKLECIKESQRTSQQLAQQENIISELSNDLAKAPDVPGLLARMGFAKTKPEIELDIQALQIQSAALHTERAIADNSLNIICDGIKRIERSIESTKDAIKTLRPRSKIEDDVANLDSQISVIDGRLAEIEKQLADTEQALIDKARVIGTTAHKTFLDSRLLKKQWDVVLVDEVSMLLLPMTYFAAGKAKKRIILVGDFQQLPAIVSSDSDNVLKWVKADPFVKWKVEQSKVRKESPPPALVSLREQGRMHEDICELVSQSFYEPKWLTTASYVKNRKALQPSLGTTAKRILFINTSALGGWSSKRYGKGSTFNITHAALIGGIIEELKRKGHSNCIGVVTPYAAQRELIATLLGDSIPEDAIGTAHKFQGGEKDTIIIDLVEASSKPSRFINAQAKSDDAGRLLNVALSRAKQHLIVVVSKRVFDKSGSKFMQQLLNRIERISEAIDPATLFPSSNYLATASEWAMGRHVVVDAKHVLFTEQDFYPAVTGDLSMARKSVVIFSAFMTTAGVTRWLAVLHKSLSLGVKVRIVTKTLDRQPGANKATGQGVRQELSHLVELIRRAGAVVDLRSETHEKIIVVDERIVWNGSLNMLSHVKDATREHMTRTDDTNYANEILSLLSRHDLRANRSIESEHPVCPECNGKTYLDTGFQGVIRLRCEDGCGWSVKQDWFRLLINGVPVGKRIKKCSNDNCDGHLILRNSFGRYFLGCTDYPSCNKKEDVSAAQFRYNPFPEQVAGAPETLRSYAWPDWQVSNDGGKNDALPTSKKGNPQQELPVKVDSVDKRAPSIVASTQPTTLIPMERRAKKKVARTVVVPTKADSKSKKSTDDFISKLGNKLFG